MRRGLIGAILVGGGLAAFFALRSSDDLPERTDKGLEPEEPAGPDKTGWKGVDAILSKLRAAAKSSGVPLGVLVGWIGKESAGRLGSYTKLDERGFFQLMPSESKAIGVDHKRLSTDADYSIDAGIKLIAKYMKTARNLGVAPEGSSYFWRLVKLNHTMGSGATKKIVDGAKAAGAAGSWEALRNHALSNERKYLSSTKHSPSKWFPLVDKVYDAGKPFGFGYESASVIGAAFGRAVIPEFSDIVDPLDAYRKRRA